MVSGVCERALHETRGRVESDGKKTPSCRRFRARTSGCPLRSARTGRGSTGSRCTVPCRCAPTARAPLAVRPRRAPPGSASRSGWPCRARPAAAAPRPRTRGLRARSPGGRSRGDCFDPRRPRCSSRTVRPRACGTSPWYGAASWTGVARWGGRAILSRNAVARPRVGSPGGVRVPRGLPPGPHVRQTAAIGCPVGGSPGGPIAHERTCTPCAAGPCRAAAAAARLARPCGRCGHVRGAGAERLRRVPRPSRRRVVRRFCRQRRLAGASLAERDPDRSRRGPGGRAAGGRSARSPAQDTAPLHGRCHMAACAGRCGSR